MRNGAVTLIAHNAGAEAANLRLDAIGRGKPKSVESVETVDLNAPLDQGLPEVRAQEPAATIRVPAYSVSRVRW